MNFSRIICDVVEWLQLKNEIVHVEWPDQHESVYPLDWLRAHRFTDDAFEAFLALHEAPEQPWAADDLQDRVPTFDYAQVRV